MAIDIKKNKSVIDKIVGEVSPQVLVECDVIVPDSKPDVLKILQVDANSVLLQKDVREGSVTLSGRVDYKILYVPDSASGAKSILASIPFHHTQQIENASAEMILLTSDEVSNVEFTLLNSRKISIKSMVDINMKVSDQIALETITDVEGEDIELQTVQLTGYHTVANQQLELSITDQLSVPAGKPTIGTLLKCDATIRNKDVKVISNKVVAKGDILVCSLYTPQDESTISFMEHTIPFTEIFDVDGISEELSNSITFQITDGQFTECEDSDGDMRMLDAQIKVGVSVSSVEPVTISAVSDVYSLTSDLNLTTTYTQIETISDHIKTQTTLKEVILPPQGIPPIMQVYNVVAKPYLSVSTCETNSATVNGTMDTYILYLSDKEDRPVYSFKYEIPFSLHLDSENCSPEDSILPTVDISHISYTFNSAGEIEVRIIVECDASIMKTVSINLVSNVEETQEPISPTPSIVLYFVQKNESLWDIAKRYHTKVTSIAELNQLEPSASLPEHTQLLIPKR